MRKLVIFMLFTGLFVRCTNLEEVWYDQVTPDTYFKSKEDIKAVLYRPFTHARWYVIFDRWLLQELTADQFAITTKGKHWYNGGENERALYHKWTPDEGWVWGTWRGTLMGVALALDAKQSLEGVDYINLNLTEQDKEADLNELNALIAYFYLRGLDFFGGLPIFEHLEGENLPRNTDREVFDHVEALLVEAIEKLPAKQAGEIEEGSLKKGAAAAMLAQLYFNAESYIGESRFSECAEISQDIIDQKYGYYELDQNWFGPHGFRNDRSPEVIWCTPSQFKKLQYDWFYPRFYHYNTRVYFDIDGGTWNGFHLQPSRKPDSTLYATQFRLGSPYEKFEEEDLRKRPYAYKGGGNYEGMFLAGPQISPISGKACVGTEEYKDKLIIFDDRVAKFKKYKEEGNLDPSTYLSKLSEGEENTGVRLVKAPIPSRADDNLRWEPDHPVIRLAEVYYMLAECKMRADDKAGAATLINAVRKRNFEGGADPDPATASDLDKYRMIDEWGIEFLGEGRRRTDLIRWNMFTTEEWWDHEPSGSAHLRRFPVPTQAISGNNNLDQNPGY